MREPAAVDDDINRPLTYDDYAAIPPDGRKWEILDGDLYVTPAPNTQHQRLSFRLQRMLADYVEPRGGEVFDAPFDVIFGRHDVAQPDLVVVTDPAQLSTRGYEGTPSFLIEILSPSNRPYDRQTKSRRYLELGVAHYWIVDPELRTIDCYRAVEGHWRQVGCFGVSDRVLEHPDFPGLEIDLARLFR